MNNKISRLLWFKRCYVDFCDSSMAFDAFYLSANILVRNDVSGHLSYENIISDNTPCPVRINLTP